MSIYSQANWSKDEDEILSSSLVDGIRLEVLEMLLPRRSPSAISTRASRNGYGTKTVNGIKILRQGIKRRNRKSKVAVKSNSFKTVKADELSPVVADESSAVKISESLDNLSDGIITKNAEFTDKGLLANQKAINMLQQKNLPINAKIVYELSKYIEEVSYAS